MGNSNSIYIDITVEDDNKLIKRKYVNGKLESFSSFPVTERSKVAFSEKEWNEIKAQGYKDVEFCILDNGVNGISECMGLFDYAWNPRASELDQYAVTKGPTTCYSYFYRPGLVYDPIVNLDTVTKELGKPERGGLCRLVYQDYNYNDADMDRCCFSDDTSRCNANLINRYSTTHCNSVMEKKCVGDELNPKCILWLEQSLTRSENSALSFYENYCSSNFDSLACNYFCKVSRTNEDYRSAFCDRALKTYCEANQFNSNCFCVITPSNIVPDLETYLGPKECWLSPCSSQKEAKWLTTAQVDTRQQCNLTSCIISIEELTLKNKSKTELINDCVSGTSVSSSFQLDVEKTKKPIRIDRTPGIFFYPNLALLAFAMILLIK